MSQKTFFGICFKFGTERDTPAPFLGQCPKKQFLCDGFPNNPVHMMRKLNWKEEKSQFFGRVSLQSEFKLDQTRLKLQQSPFSRQSLEVDWTVPFEFFMNHPNLTWPWIKISWLYSITSRNLNSSLLLPPFVMGSQVFIGIVVSFVKCEYKGGNTRCIGILGAC